MWRTFLRMAFVLMAYSIVSCHICLAVVISSTTDNTTAPPDQTFPWDNVGITNGGSAVYLGDRWVLTARHVAGAPTTVEFPGIGTFPPLADSWIPIENSDPSLTEFTDLVLFRLQDNPGLPSIPIASETPAVGTEVYVVGNGRDREDEITYWNADITPVRNDWTETDDVNAEYAGYKTLSTKTKRWGTSLIEDDEQLYFEFDSGHTRTWPVNGLDVVFLITEFDKEGYSNSVVLNSDSSPETEFESQAVFGDSGGGLFVQNDGVWELAGIINAVDGYSGQEEPGGPSGVFNALFGAKTLSANLADYRDTIISHSGFPAGDFDSDGRLSQNDIDLLTGVMLSGVVPPTFDLNDDLTIDQEDRRIWVEDLASTYFGDSNLDGQFNSNDLVVVFQHAGYEDGIAGNSTWATGDWNGDADFDSGDFVAAFTEGGYEKGPKPAALVPESHSSTSLLVCISLLFRVMISRRR